MAIKFMDEEQEKVKPARSASRQPDPEPQAEAIQSDPPDGMPDGQLPFAKSEPKPRGRKKPLK